MSAKPSTAPHGTTSRYAKGCRCETCRHVKSLAQAQYNKTGEYVLTSHPNLARKLRHEEKAATT